MYSIPRTDLRSHIEAVVDPIDERDMTEQSRYSFEDYDKYSCLKPNADMWLVIAYLVHSFVLFIVYLVTQFRMRGGAGEVGYLGAMHPVSVLSAVPAITVVWAYFNRAPGKAGFTRAIWHHGHALLLLSCALSTVHPLWVITHTRHIDAIPVLLLTLDLAALIYLVTSRRVKEVFADYPEVRS